MYQLQVPVMCPKQVGILARNGAKHSSDRCSSTAARRNVLIPLRPANLIAYMEALARTQLELGLLDLVLNLLDNLLLERDLLVLIQLGVNLFDLVLGSLDNLLLGNSPRSHSV